MRCTTPEVMFIGGDEREGKTRSGDARVYKSGEFVETAEDSEGSMTLNIGGDIRVKDFKKFGRYKLTIDMRELRTRNGVFTITEVVDFVECKQ